MHTVSGDGSREPFGGGRQLAWGDLPWGAGVTDALPYSSLPGVSVHPIGSTHLWSEPRGHMTAPSLGEGRMEPVLDGLSVCA